MHLADHTQSTNTDINISKLGSNIFHVILLNSAGKSIHYLFELTSLNRHGHTNIQTTGNNTNKARNVTNLAATNTFGIVPGTVVGNTWILQKRFLVQLPIFRFPRSYLSNPLAPQWGT